MGKHQSRAAELGEILGAMAAQSIAVQRRFDDACAVATARYSHGLDRMGIPPDLPLRKLLQPRLQLVDEFRAGVSLRTEIRRRTEFDVGLRIAGRTVSSFLRRVTDSKETEETHLEITVVRTPAPTAEFHDVDERGR